MFALLFWLYIALVNAVVVIVNNFVLLFVVRSLLMEGYYLPWVIERPQTDICTMRMRTFLQLS